MPHKRHVKVDILDTEAVRKKRKKLGQNRSPEVTHVQKCVVPWPDLRDYAQYAGCPRRTEKKS